jgi:hypothetical protein
VADILLGALDARLRSRGVGADPIQGRELGMSLRIGGIAAILGAGFWAVGLALAVRSTATSGEPDFTAPLLIGSVALLVAIAGLSAFQARTHPRLIWAAFAVVAVGTIVTFVSFTGLFDDVAWTLLGLGIVIGWIGFVLFAVVTVLTSALWRAGAMLLTVGTVLPIVLMAAMRGGEAFDAVTIESVSLVISMACFPIAWLVLGIEAIRLDRPAVRPA